MKRFVFFLIGVLVSVNAMAEGVVLSDTSIEEEPFVAPQTQQPQQVAVVDSFDADVAQPVAKNSLSNDTSDPLFLVGDNSFLSDTYVSFLDDKLRIGEYLGYGINNNFVFHANMHYQIDFSHDHENGFSATEFGGTYRMNHGGGKNHIIADALFGLKLWGGSHIRTPEYADSSYFAGLRFGRQYNGITLAGTVKSTWVFDDNRGLSYIDFIPEAYLRFQYNWRMGLGFDIRRSTNPHLLSNQEWVNFKLLRQFGNTQYIGKLDYEFDSHDLQAGFNIRILF